jgi:uncharacterized surface protein with fasciclin (FAS1) repeats
MVSIGPYTQTYDMSHMYNITDLIPKCSDKIVIEYPESTLMRTIGITPEFSKFARVVSIAGMEEYFANPLNEVTVFVPLNDTLRDIADETYTSMDIGTARKIVLGMTMKRKIPSELLTQSPSSLFSSLGHDRLQIATARGVVMLNEVVIVSQFDIDAGNGIIHVTNGFLWPC